MLSDMNQSSKNNICSNSLSPNYPEYKLQDIVCDCMTIKRKEIIPLIDKVSNIDDLVSCSGVGSVCTGCHPLLHEMMGVKIWTHVKILSIQQVSGDAKTYRFESLDEPFESAKSGQHILLQAYVNGSWKLRRYTLTTPAGETAYREITVQREADGLISNWLFELNNGSNINDSNDNVDQTDPKLRISQPMGQIEFDLFTEKNNEQPLVCMVGGIGVTPALSVARTAQHIRNKQQFQQQPSLSQQHHDKIIRKIWIDYSVQNQNRLVYADELSEYDSKNDDIHVKIRLTDNDGFINQAHVNEIVESNQNGEYFICGPATFIDAVTDYLITADVPESNITVELFSVPEARKVKQSKTYFYLGLFLFAAFFIQDLLQLKIQWLETLQMNESYKVYSGLGLILYILMQFVLPYNKSCETPHTAANSYNRHKLRGVFMPLVFFIHSTHIGVAYLFLLSFVFFTNILVGLFNHELISNPVKRICYFKYWLPLHIILSVLLVTLIGFHIFVVASY